MMAILPKASDPLKGSDRSPTWWVAVPQIAESEKVNDEKSYIVLSVARTRIGPGVALDKSEYREMRTEFTQPWDRTRARRTMPRVSAFMFIIPSGCSSRRELS